MARLTPLLSWLVACAAIAGTAALLGRQVQPVRVAGASMSPALLPGDIALVSPTRAVAMRDVVLIRERGRAAVLHRIVGPKGNGAWVTQGDANPVPDLEPISTSAIEGRVIGVVRVGALAQRWRGALGGAKLANQSDSTRR